MGVLASMVHHFETKKKKKAERASAKKGKNLN